MADPVLRLVEEWSNGDRTALDRMMPAIYGQLRQIAEAFLHRERPGHTLQPTALVHEVYLKLVGQRQVDWTNRAQFLAVAARIMRRVLADYSDRHRAAKRADALRRVPLDDRLQVTSAGEVDFLDLDSALQKLEADDPRQAEIVELRFFSGLTTPETAAALGVSVATVEREWATARLWLARRLSRPGEGH